MFFLLVHSLVPGSGPHSQVEVDIPSVGQLPLETSMPLCVRIGLVLELMPSGALTRLLAVRQTAPS